MNPSGTTLLIQPMVVNIDVTQLGVEFHGILVDEANSLLVVALNSEVFIEPQPHRLKQLADVYSLFGSL